MKIKFINSVIFSRLVKYNKYTTMVNAEQNVNLLNVISTMLFMFPVTFIGIVGSMIVVPVELTVWSWETSKYLANEFKKCIISIFQPTPPIDNGGDEGGDNEQPPPPS